MATQDQGNASLPDKVEQGVFDVGDAPPWNEVGYSSHKTAKIVGITYRQLDHWARTELWQPSLVEATGSGTKRRYSFTDLVALKVIKSMRDAGLSLQAARKAVDYLTEHLDEDLSSANLVIEGKNSVLVYSGDVILDLVRDGQVVLNIVPLHGIVAELAPWITKAKPSDEGTVQMDANAGGR